MSDEHERSDGSPVLPLAELAAAYIDRVVNQRDWRAVRALVTEDYEGSGYGWPATRDELEDFYRWQSVARPDWHIDVLASVSLGSCVVIRAHAGGTIAAAEADRPSAAPDRQEVDWMTAYWFTGSKIRRMQVLHLE